MSKVVVAQSNDGARAIRGAIDDLGLTFVDFVKSASSICIVSTGSREATQAVIDAIVFHSRASIHVLGPDDMRDTVEATILRETSLNGVVDGKGEEMRMTIRRPRALLEADAAIMIAALLPDVRRRTELAIEQYLFQTWTVPERSGGSGFLHAQDPWLEGELRDVVLADLYMQKPLTLAFLDGSESSSATLASFDAIAVDSVAMRMREVDPESVGYLSELTRQGFGNCILSKIDVPLGTII